MISWPTLLGAAAAEREHPSEELGSAGQGAAQSGQLQGSLERLGQAR